tara:strand:+ start:1381 stop:1968 length:588 start_codon:yes stop_codon:yes gene_type:complete
MAYNSTTWTTGSSSTSVSTTTQSLYAYYGVNEAITGFLAGGHYFVPFQPSAPMSSGVIDVDIGSGTDPDTSFTSANTDTQFSGQISSYIWYLPDNIYIDKIISIQGSDNNTADTTRMHLMSYDYTANSTSVLTNGAVVGYSSDVSVENTKTQLTEWTISTNSISSGKALLATFRKDSGGGNGNHSVNIIVKYHLT